MLSEIEAALENRNCAHCAGKRVQIPIDSEHHLSEMSGAFGKQQHIETV